MLSKDWKEAGELAMQVPPEAGVTRGKFGQRSWVAGGDSVRAGVGGEVREVGMRGTDSFGRTLSQTSARDRGKWRPTAESGTRCSVCSRVPVTWSCRVAQPGEHVVRLPCGESVGMGLGGE